MTLIDIERSVKERYLETEFYEICQIVNSLEHKLICEIFSPCGISVRDENLNAGVDMYSELLLKDEHILLYVYYAFWVLAIKELNLEAANTYSKIFNEKFNELAIFYRRNYTPIKNTKLGGWF